MSSGLCLDMMMMIDVATQCLFLLLCVSLKFIARQMETEK